MARQCPNSCGRSFREHGNGLAFHLTWCVPVEPSSADPIDRAIASIAEPTRPEPIPAMRPVLVRTVRRGPADADADMPIAEPARKARAYVNPWGPVAAMRKARTSRKAPSTNVVRDGRDVLVGPVRVSFLDFADLPASEHGRVREMLKNGGKGLAPARSRAERVLRVADPLATTAAPIVGWRAPVSDMPALAYVTDPGTYEARRFTCTYPRLEPIRATAEERKAARRPVSRGKGPGA